MTDKKNQGTKPRVRLTGQDGNVFNVIGLVEKALRQAGQNFEAAEFVEKAFNAGSYDEVLQLAMRYSDVS